MVKAPRLLRRYWDSSCFIRILNDEEGAENCLAVLESARVGRTLICISAIVAVEVIRPKGSSSPLDPKVRRRVRALLEDGSIIFAEIDRPIAYRSQELCWEFDLRPRDAIHLAVALYLNCELSETYDRDLLKLDRKTSLWIREPSDLPPGSLFAGVPNGEDC